MCYCVKNIYLCLPLFLLPLNKHDSQSFLETQYPNLFISLYLNPAVFKGRITLCLSFNSIFL